MHRTQEEITGAAIDVLLDHTAQMIDPQAHRVRTSASATLRGGGPDTALVVHQIQRVLQASRYDEP